MPRPLTKKEYANLVAMQEKLLRYCRRHKLDKARIWVTRSLKFGVMNQNYATRYFTDITKARAFLADCKVPRRDTSAEYYERKRRRILATLAEDPTAGHLGWIAPNKFPLPERQ